jgi:tetratricopeptide (TPR) repeat protein
LGYYKEFDRISERINHFKPTFKEAVHTINPDIGSTSFTVSSFTLFMSAFERARPDLLHKRISAIQELQQEDIPISELRILVQTQLGIYHLLQGEFTRSIDFFKQLSEEAQQIGMNLIANVVSGYFSLAQYHQGSIEEALNTSLKFMEFSYETSHLMFSCAGQYSAEVLALCGYHQEVIELLDKVLPALENDKEAPALVACYRVKALAYILMFEDDSHDEEILQLLEKSKQITDKIGCNFLNPFIHFNYEEFYKRKGDVQKAQEHNDKALQYFMDYGLIGWYEHFKKNPYVRCKQPHV